MIKKYCFVLFTVLTCCNDGDFVVETLDFDQNSISVCESFKNQLTITVFDSSNTEVLLINTSAIDSIPTEEGEVTLKANTNLSYNLFDGNASKFYCQSIPPTTPKLVQQWVGSYTDIVITTSVTKDDNDGLEEAVDPTIDTDGDGIPNYYDSDDDGDNVPTSVELMQDEQGNFADSDDDGIPNYLDPDDDGDGVLTRNEASQTNQTSPEANIQNASNGVANYLLADLTEVLVVTQNRVHTYTDTVENKIIINDMVLTNQQEQSQVFEGAFDYGTYSSSIDRRTTPN